MSKSLSTPLLSKAFKNRQGILFPIFYLNPEKCGLLFRLPLSIVACCSSLTIILFLFVYRGNYIENTNKGKWFKFNDTVVEEFEMSEGALEAECFGGKYKARVYDQCKCKYSKLNKRKL